MPPTVWANREDCAVVAVVWVVPFATYAGVELPARARLTWRKQARRHMRMWPIRDCLSVVERLVGIESVTKADSLGREDSGTGTLSFSGISGGGFPGEGTALTFAVFPAEPGADKSLASRAEVQSPPVVVVVWLSDRTVGRLGPGEPQRYSLRAGDTECYSVERLGVDDDAAFNHVPYGLFWVSRTVCTSFAMEKLACCTLCGRSSFSHAHD